MASWRKQHTSNDFHMADSPPAYQVDREDTLAPRWYDFRRWSKKIWVLLALGIVIIIAAIIAIAVVVSKKNRYPNYSKLSYSLKETYGGADFFKKFDYFTGYDPTGGFVHYVPSEQATSLNLTYASSSSAIIRVDTSVTADSEPNASTGRFSARLTSKNQYGLNNLFVFDVKHTPMGCGTWPALWLTDPSNWPKNGEIDIMEQVNVVGDTHNQMTLHTSKGCDMSVKRKQTGSSLGSSCVNSTDNNAGCGVKAGSNTFGASLNDNGGAVVAMELRQAGIRMWQWARGSVPADVTSDAPDPSSWGEATADFPGTDCDIGSHFANQSIIANIDLCGSWAGDSKIYGETCPGLCTDQVANNATAFTDAYWEFGAFSVYSAS